MKKISALLAALLAIALVLSGCNSPLQTPDTTESQSATETVTSTHTDEATSPEDSDTSEAEDPSSTDSVSSEDIPTETTDEPSLSESVTEGTQSATEKPESETQSSSTTKATEITDENSESEYQPPVIEFDYSDKQAFYENYVPAVSYEDATARTAHGLMSGLLTVPDQAPTLSDYQPRYQGLLVRNNEPYYIDTNTYVIVDAYGEEVMRIYKGGAYITLEEVAAYVYAFGDVPANYTSSKKTKPTSSIWGEYLRVNHSSFSGSTTKYPYEPMLPDISGCGGSLYYYEIDIGTTGTDCDPKYTAALYNNGTSITRGAARIVYTRYDANRNSIIDPNEKFVFYTYNHYNDFQEYLNYYGGWGEMFGNVTGGGTISSKLDYNPTPYVPVYMGSLDVSIYTQASTQRIIYYAWIDERAFSLLYAA